MKQQAFGETPRPSKATLARSFRYAWLGIVNVLRSQRNARIHLVIGMLALGTSLALRLSPANLAIVVVCVTLVITAEMMNTVIEAVVDLVTEDYHALAKVAKDVAAGTVLVTACGSAVVGLLVIGPPLWHAVHW